MGATFIPLAMVMPHVKLRSMCVCASCSCLLMCSCNNYCDDGVREAKFGYVCVSACSSGHVHAYGVVCIAIVCHCNKDDQFGSSKHNACS